MLLLHVMYPPSYDRQLYVRTRRWYYRKLRAGHLFAQTPLFTALVTQPSDLFESGK